MAAAFSVFYDLLLPELKGCTTAFLDLHLLHTARDLCKRTSSWRVAFTTSSVAAQPNYDISAPEPKSEVVRVTRLAIDGALLWDDRWNGEGKRWPSATQTQVPKYRRDNPPFTLNPENTEFTFIDDEVPSTTGVSNIALIASLKPSFTATSLPDYLKSEHVESLRVGTLSRLMLMGGKPWTDRSLGQEYAADYARLCSFAATSAQNGNTKQRLRTRKAGI